VSDHGLDDDEPASLGGGDSMVAVSKTRVPQLGSRIVRESGR
jgi:hypothetical protein